MTTISLVTLLFFQRQRDYISMAFYTNVIVLYTIGKLFLSSIQWWYFPHSHESSDSVICNLLLLLLLLLSLFVFVFCMLLLLDNIGVGQEWQNTIPEGLTSIHLTLGE